MVGQWNASACVESVGSRLLKEVVFNAYIGTLITLYNNCCCIATYTTTVKY